MIAMPALARGRIVPAWVCEQPETTVERVSVVLYWLMHGEGLTTRQVAKMTGLTSGGARAMMCGMSRVLPIRQDDRHRWEWTELARLA